MDSTSAVAAPASLALRLQNLAASAAVVTLACAIYRFIPDHRNQLEALYGSTTFSFTGIEYLVASAACYVALLALFFVFERDPEVSKSLRFTRVAAAFVRSPLKRWRQGLTRGDRLAVLTTLLKSFFAPMMAMSLMVFCMHALENGSAIVTNGDLFAGFGVLFDRHGYWFLLQLILFVDVLVFTAGYLVELPRLHNEIRSVDPTLVGWGAVLICYPPFNTLTGAILGSPVSDFPKFDNPTVHISLNLALLALMAVYASASVALGFKGSNLTHRGIVARGPYAVIRHPAYTCKNLAWWIGSIPLVSTAFAQSTWSGVFAVGSVAGWSSIYILRALTEEDHLKGVDGEYASYAGRVRHRFIPGVI
jgi:protein-S-isoprenylcysteine O-methyltransferase Ste14